MGPFLGRSAAFLRLLAAASVVGCYVVVGCVRLWAGVGSMFVEIVAGGAPVSSAVVVVLVVGVWVFAVEVGCRWCWSIVVSWLFDERVHGCLSLNRLWVVVCVFTWR